MMRPRSLSDNDIEASVRTYTDAGWRVENVDNDAFNLFAPNGSAYRSNGIRLAERDDEAVDFELLTDEQQEEECAAGALCELVVLFRLRTGRLLETP